MRVNSVENFNEALEVGPYAWPGGYPTFFVTADGGVLSHAAALDNRELIASAIAERDSGTGWCVEQHCINWEDQDLTCDHSGQRIECAYSDDSDAA